MGLVFPFFFDLPRHNIVLPIGGASGDKLQNLEKLGNDENPKIGAVRFRKDDR
jgi:hypothetical protein